MGSQIYLANIQKDLKISPNEFGDPLEKPIKMNE